MFGAASGSLASLVRCDVRTIALKPAALTFKEASTLPSTWGTVHVAMGRQRLRGQQGLVLHAASGGVGLAMIEYAHWLRAAAIASAGRPHKHKLLHALGIVRAGSSRDASAWLAGTSRSMRGLRVRALVTKAGLVAS